MDFPANRFLREVEKVVDFLLDFAGLCLYWPIKLVFVDAELLVLNDEDRLLLEMCWFSNTPILLYRQKNRLGLYVN